MKVQRVVQPGGRVSWIVIGDNYKPIRAISSYLRFLESLDRSPYTIQNRASHLKEYWRFLAHHGFEWADISLEQLAEFIFWLKTPNPEVSSIVPVESARTERSINTMLSTIYSFYAFHQKNSGIQGIDGYTKRMLRNPKYKPFLHGITKGTPSVRSKLLKLKEPTTFPGCLSEKDVKTLIDACSLIRDKFLLSLLYETGVRLGEALGLRHEDIESAGKNEIHIVSRVDNLNKVRTKNLKSRAIHASKELMRLYSAYLIDEYPENIDGDYVFVNVKREPIGKAMTTSNVQSLFKKLKNKTGIEATPHLFRHTHATELIRTGKWDMSFVQQRLGHSSIQTTINTYIHLSDDDMKSAYQAYMENKNGVSRNDQD